MRFFSISGEFDGIMGKPYLMKSIFLVKIGLPKETVAKYLTLTDYPLYHGHPLQDKYQPNADEERDSRY